MILPSFTKESEDYASRVAGQNHKIGGGFRWLPVIFEKTEYKLKFHLRTLSILIISNIPARIEQFFI